MTSCSRSSRLKRGTIGAVIGAAIGGILDAGVIVYSLSGLHYGGLGATRSEVFNGIIYGLPIVGAVSGAYIAARKPQCV